ncbi:microtubule-associated tumor suppressor candidate 2 [Salarias fasciatus]|uniref:microtubule-associated tumor suppressor candidate 2 n=1 Tax=Salarias fasciatus TaxID=181472 RepID=UPI001176C559|nr:microtubule-associated tumor suppressor candidate 2-like [Salarias fasciatus]
MCEREEPFSEGELRNNNQPGGVLADGDANANEIRVEDDGKTGDTGSLLGPPSETTEPDKVIIWGTDSQCDDPELAEFEMLECQELEAYLVEDGEDFVGLAERNQLQEHHSSCSTATLEQESDNSREERKPVVREASEQESSASHVSESREASRNELSSETDVFVTCLSTVSSMVTAADTVGRTQITDSWQFASGPQSTISEDLTLASQIVSDRGKADHPSLSARKSTIQHKEVDVNLNSTVRSEDAGSHARVSNAVLCKEVRDEHRKSNNMENKAGNPVLGGDCNRGRSTEHKSLPKVFEESNTKMDKSTQADESPPKTGTRRAQSIDPKAMRKQGSFDNTLKKQNSFDRSFKKQPSFEYSLKKQLSFDNSLKKPGSAEHTVVPGSSSLERRKPWVSPSRSVSPASPKNTSCSPKRRPPGSPAKVQGSRALSLERSDSPYRGLSQPVKPPGKTSLSSGIPKPVMPQQKESEPRRSSPPQKPKNVRPKIITYVRKNPQAKPQGPDAPHETRLSSYTIPPPHKDPKAATQPKSTPVLCSSNLLFDKYRQEMQKAGYCPPGGMKPPGSTIPQRLGGKSDSFHEDMPEKYLQEHVSQEGGSVYRSPRTLRPQLGLGAVTRQPAAKPRVQQTGQRSAPGQTAQAGRGSAPAHQELAGEQRRSGPETTPKSLLLKSGQSGLRPPGFSALPPARLAAFGFVRTSSGSSASSNQSNDSGHSQLSRKDLQRDTEAAQSPKSSPKRFAVVSPKPQSPVRGRPAAAGQGGVRADRAQELDRALIQQLRERCERQALQLQTLQAQLKKASLCLDVFSITTQHFCHQSESAIVKERELSLELARIRDEVAFSVAHWEKLQREKEEQERRFEAELQRLRAQQQRELGALEERLKARHAEQTHSLRAQQRAELDELRCKQQEQLEEMSESHEASLVEMETTHNDTLATLQEEHARTVKNLKMAHEQQRKSLEEEFEKIRLSLQDQVDTLTFQNRSLRDRAKRFEEALRRSTDEQIVDALAPYKHIEEDLKSLKEVLEMKNQQIHQQELKITELEKIQAEKNVYLEEKLQVLQQQNEDLKERIDKNLAVSRQLSEENANLQVHVEKESNEKKRLSRTNEELLWRLQTGELSPRMSPSSSPVHRPPSGQGSPARPHSYHQ